MLFKDRDSIYKPIFFKGKYKYYHNNILTMKFSAYVGALQIVISVVALIASIFLYAEGPFDKVLLLYILFFFFSAFSGIDNLRKC